MAPTCEIRRARRFSCKFKGVWTCVFSFDKMVTLPISVLSPTRITTASPWPFITIVERRIRFGGYVLSWEEAGFCVWSHEKSCCWAAAVASLPRTSFVARGSPVSVDSSICRLMAEKSSASAGTSSPTSTNITSPTTMSRRGISVTLPFRLTLTSWSSFSVVSTRNFFSASRSK